MNAAEHDLLMVDEQLRRDFERAWESQAPPPLEQYLPAPDSASRLGTLVELVCIEMEHQWRRAAGDRSRVADRVADYLRRFPELATPAAARELIEQELMLRRRGGEAATWADYAQWQTGPAGAGAERAGEPAVDSPVDSAVDSEDMETRLEGSTLARGRLEPPDLDVPRRIGNYELLKCIGSGGMGQVFLARHERLDTLAAVKLLKSQSSAGQLHSRFLREGRAAAQVRHEHVASAFDAGEDGGWSYIVFELVPGRNLRQLVLAEGPLRVDVAIDCIRQAAIGLAHVHRCGIVHRDVKPANLMRDDQGVIKVLDLGLAGVREQADCSELTSFNTLMGTVDYMAPEQGIDPRSATPAADIYSLGCTLYFLLTGSRMYDGPTYMARLLAHREQPAPSLAAGNPAVSAALETVFQTMVAKRPELRYASMDDVLTALGAIEREGTAPETHNERDTAGPRSRPRRAVTPMWLAGAVAASLLGVVLWGISDARHRAAQRGDPAAAPPAKATALVDRDKVTWLLEHGMRVTVDDGDRQVTLERPAEASADAPAIIGVELTDSARVPDLLAALPLADLQNLAFNGHSIATTELRVLASQSPQLTRLNLGGSPLQDVDLSCLAELRELHTLWVGRAELDRRAVERIVTIKQLAYLWIGENNLDDGDVRVLAQLPNLLGLGLERTRVTGACLEALAGRELQTLILDGTLIGDEDLEALSRLTTLQGLSLDNTAVSAGARRRLRAALPQCDVKPHDD
ncbi:MAG: protein kinase [Planctomycetales bacterium]|nr:protein kinase [Planctomycetales bacterium]